MILIHHGRSFSGPGALLLALALALPGFVPRPALAQSSADKTAARQLVIEGREKRDKGDYQGALQNLKAAHDIMHVPTTGLDLAKIQVLLNHLLEGQEALLSVKRYELKPGDPPAFANAQAEGAALEQEIGPRIPSLMVNVGGPSESAELRVRVDGDLVPRAALPLPRKVNPGKHEVTVESPGYEAARQSIDVGERESKVIQIMLARSSGVTLIPQPLQPKEQIAPQRNGTTGRKTAPWAWIAGGVGVASAGASIGLGVDFSSVRNQTSQFAASVCPADKCPNTPENAMQMNDLKAHWNRSLTLTIVFAVVGATGIGVGAYGIRTSATVQQEMAVLPWLLPGSGGAVVAGRF